MIFYQNINVMLQQTLVYKIVTSTNTDMKRDYG